MRNALALGLALALTGCAAAGATAARITIRPVMPMLVENPTLHGHCVTGGVQLAGAVEITDALCWRATMPDSSIVSSGDASAP